jgi:hypothetical protein
MANVRLDDNTIRMNGIDALNKALGPAAALRFLSLFTHESTDYVEISKKLYENQSVDEIFERAKKHWKG